MKLYAVVVAAVIVKYRTYISGKPALIGLSRGGLKGSAPRYSIWHSPLLTFFSAGKKDPTLIPKCFDAARVIARLDGLNRGRGCTWVPLDAVRTDGLVVSYP